MSRIVNKFSWKVGGAAGDGILNAGLQMFAKTCLRGGLQVFATAEYPSLIRGGHNNLDVHVCSEPVHSHTKETNLLVAFNRDTIDKHKHELTEGAGVIFDGDNVKVEPDEFEKKIKLCPVPLLKLANESGGKIMRNTVALGATMALLDFDMEIFNGVVKDNFLKKKGQMIVDANIKAAKAGYDYVKKTFKEEFGWKLEKLKRENNLFMSGNEAITAGAIKGGCKFYSAYPMTPASSVMINLAAQERNFGIVVKHTEDELAAVVMAVGAAYAGVRSATGTSGGGFCLMSEGFGLANMTETPIVIIEAQRPGPGSGMATHTSQGDLRFMMHASTDEAPRIIIAPGDIEDCFFKTIDAFNLAEKYQMPVIILTDKFLGESYATAPEFDVSNVKIERGKLMSQSDVDKETDYMRYKITEDGISPRAIPSQKGAIHVASSYEHDEHGNECEDEDNRVAMHDKRFRKLDNADKEIERPKVYGDGDVTLLSWGSTKGPVREAQKLLEKDGIKTKFVHVIFVSPFPTKEMAELAKDPKTIIIENNKTALFASMIREHTGLEVPHKILKYDGRTFAPEDIRDGVKQALNNKKEVVFSRHGIIRAE